MRAGTSSAGGRGAWRSLRSSPRSGKPATWRREAASRSTRERNGRRSLVNTGAPSTRVLRIQTAPTPTSWRLVESRMRGDAHVRFGGRAEETDRPKDRHRASARPLQEGPCGHHRQGADPDPPNSEPITCGPAVPAQSGAAGLVRLLPPRGVQPHLRLPGGLRLASDPPLAAAPAPPQQLEDPAPSLPPRMAPDAGRGGDVPAQHGAGLPLPLPGPPHPDPMGDRDGTDRKARGMNSWRAGCVETRTSGSEGGLRKRTGRKTGTAPQPDPYVWRDQAEHLADSLSKGDRVMVTGRLRQRSWETPEGERRSVPEIEADEVGASLRFATAKVERAQERGPSDRSQGRERQAERGGDLSEPPPF